MSKKFGMKNKLFWSLLIVITSIYTALAENYGSQEFSSDASSIHLRSRAPIIDNLPVIDNANPIQIGRQTRRENREGEHEQHGEFRSIDEEIASLNRKKIKSAIIFNVGVWLPIHILWNYDKREVFMQQFSVCTWSTGLIATVFPAIILLGSIGDHDSQMKNFFFKKLCRHNRTQENIERANRLARRDNKILLGTFALEMVIILYGIIFYPYLISTFTLRDAV